MADSTGGGDHWGRNRGGGWTQRTYCDGHEEWRQDRGGWIKWVQPNRHQIQPTWLLDRCTQGPWSIVRSALQYEYQAHRVATPS